MTSTAAVIGLTFRGTDIQDIDGIFLEIVRGLIESLEARGTDLVIPSRAGQTVRNRVGHRLGIELRGWIRGVGATDEDDDRADFAANRAIFRTLFDTTLAPGSLVATLEDASTQSISARTLNVISDPMVPTWVNVSIEMESVDPDWTIGTS